MEPQYAAPLRALHWLIAALVICLVIAGLLMHYDLVAKPVHHVLLWLHVSVGLSVLALMLLRLCVRLATGAPALPGAIPAAERLAARLSHGAMYALLFAMPVFGVIFMQAHGRVLTWFGLITLPPLVAQNRPVSHLFAGLHFWGGWALIGLITLHLAALVWHKRQGIRLLPRIWR